LSGGEKTIAALAFIFALADVKKPPFLIMDEVDAFLDAENVEAVTKYLSLLAQNNTCQSFVISHKEQLA
jgi:chromosome segregation protein